VKITLDGKDYEEGSSAHLKIIAEMHKAEIAKQTEAHVQDISERKDLEHRTRQLSDELEHGVRDRTAAMADARLADATAATQQSEDRFRLLVDGVKDYALCMLDTSGNVVSWNAGAERIEGTRHRRSSASTSPSSMSPTPQTTNALRRISRPPRRRAAPKKKARAFARTARGFSDIPVLVAGAQHLRAAQLDGRAGFILSLIDGVTTVESLLDLSDMPTD